MQNSTTKSSEIEKKYLIELSEKKWRAMSDREMDFLERLFHEQAMFVHMGATLNKEQELHVIRTGDIHYKQARIEEVSVEIIGDTAILLNKLRLDAVVHQNEVTNPFVVTEVYLKLGQGWKLGSMAFTRLLGD